MPELSAGQPGGLAHEGRSRRCAASGGRGMAAVPRCRGRDRGCDRGRGGAAGVGFPRRGLSGCRGRAAPCYHAALRDAAAASAAAAGGADRARPGHSGGGGGGGLRALRSGELPGAAGSGLPAGPGAGRLRLLLAVRARRGRGVRRRRGCGGTLRPRPRMREEPPAPQGEGRPGAPRRRPSRRVPLQEPLPGVRQRRAHLRQRLPAPRRQPARTEPRRARHQPAQQGSLRARCGAGSGAGGVRDGGCPLCCPASRGKRRASRVLLLPFFPIGVLLCKTDGISDPP